MSTINKETMPKVRRSVTISKELLTWINEEIEKRRFKDVSHAIEYSLYHVKEELEKQEINE
jgi:Arc/MetJ-type ribon-helix-helix transcriptional regulator